MGLQTIGPLLAEVTFGEGGKFTAPLVLVHGLWSGATLWRPFSGYLSHRGWTCFAVEVEDRAERGDPADGFERVVADLRAAIATLEAPPVLIGHDLGALAAQCCADVTCATVMVAPLVLPPLAAAAPELLRDAGGLLERLLGRRLRMPGRRWKSSYGAIGGKREAAALLRRLAERPMPLTPAPEGAPSLVVAGGGDAVTPPDTARRLASALGAEIEIVAGGHALPVDPGWEALVSHLHRWLVKKLGAGLLALYEEAVAERDGDR